MPATNYTPIQLYRTNTASTTAPSAGNLNAGELAINYNDGGMILYAKNTTGNVIKLMNNPANLLYPTTDGTAGQPIKTDGSGTLTFGTLGVAGGGTGITTGTSGGVPYFSASNTIASSTALAANALVIGGGAGVAPSTTTTGAGILTFLGTPSSANLASAVTDETGTGALVFATTPVITALREKSTAVSASDIDLSAGNYFTKTISGTTTFTVSNVATTGDVSAFILVLTDGGSNTVNWFSGVTWNNATPPTLTASGIDILGFFTIDGGTTWRGLVLAQAVA